MFLVYRLDSRANRQSFVDDELLTASKDSREEKVRNFPTLPAVQSNSGPSMCLKSPIIRGVPLNWSDPLVLQSR